MTWLEFVNKFFFQWFFVRLTKHREKVIKNIDLHSVSLLGSGNAGVAYTVRDLEEVEYYSLQRWIVPLTGWNTDFIYLNKKPKFFKLTRARKKK